MGRCHCNVYMRVMTCDCGNRCQGSPRTSASNCCCVSVSAALPALPLSLGFGHTKPPVLRRRAQHQTPKPSCTSSLTRFARALAKQVAVMGLGLAEHLHDPREQPLGADAHVHRLDREPQGIDADHRRISRAQAAHCAAAVIGQVDFIVNGPRRNSISMVTPFAGCSTVTGTKPTASPTGPAASSLT